MNLRRNTVLFFLGATVLNVVLLFFYFLVFQGIVALFLPNRQGWVSVGVWVLLFPAALAAGWFTNRLLYRLLNEKYQIEKKIETEIFKNLF